MTTDGKIKSASYSFSSTGKITFQVSSEVKIGKSNPIVLNASAGSITLGKGHAWSSNFGSPWCYDTVEQGDSDEQFLVYPLVDKTLEPDTDYHFTISSTGSFVLSSISIGEAASKPATQQPKSKTTPTPTAPTPTPPSGSSAKIMDATYSFSTDGEIQFQVSADVTIGKDNPLIVVAKDGDINTGKGQAWNDNFGGTWCALQIAKGSVTDQYLIYPILDKKLKTGTTYSFKMSSTGSFKLSGMYLGEKNVPVPPKPKPIVHPKPNPGDSTVSLRVGYVQLSGEHSAKLIAPEGIQSCNLIVFAFAPIDKSKPPSSPSHFMKEIQYVMDNSSEGTKFFYSVGGANNSAKTINKNTASSIIKNVTDQINYINSNVKGSLKIEGVDLDMEVLVDTETIKALGTGFKNQKVNGKSLLLSLAPQIVSSDGKDISSSNPYNLALSSGFDASCSNAQYNPAINDIAPDYLFVQTYNTPNVTIDSHHEYDTTFFSSAISALDNLAKGNITLPTGVTLDLSIKIGVTAGNTKIAVGLPSNRGAGNQWTIYNSSGDKYSLGTSYEQSTALTAIKNQLGNLTTTVNGVMTWSLNNDYSPQLYQDAFAVAGAFCQEIFKAKAVPAEPQVPYMTLFVRYGSGKKGAIVVTVITEDGNYLVFGRPNTNPALLGTSLPLAPGGAITWTTLTALLNPSAAITSRPHQESGALDQLAAAAPTAGPGADSIKGRLMVSYYENETDSINTPTYQSHPVDITLYTNCDNFVSVGIKVTDAWDIETQPTIGSHAADGAIFHGWAPANSKDTNNVKYEVCGFQWSLGYYSMPGWMKKITETLANMTLDAIIGAAGGPAAVFACKMAGIDFEEGSDTPKQKTEPESSVVGKG